MPEMLYHLRKNYDYWKELHDKGLTEPEGTETVPKKPKFEKEFSFREEFCHIKEKKNNTN